MSDRVKQFDVEVIAVDDPWKEFGSPLPNTTPATVSDIVQKNRSPRLSWRWLHGIVAALMTVLLHAVIFSSLLLGVSSRKYEPPMMDGSSVSASSEQGEFVSTLIFINDHSVTQPEAQDDSAYVVMQQSDQSMKAPPEFAMLSSTPQIEISGSDEGTDPNSQSIEAAGDAAGRAMLFGRYMGQVKARIERAWVYPVNASIASFKCTAQIKQTKQGEVQEVTLQRCDSGGAWQLSLAKAIQAASPLPAPPDEQVFTEVITLSFDVDGVRKN
jgi:hypothetical protein